MAKRVVKKAHSKISTARAKAIERAVKKVSLSGKIKAKSAVRGKLTVKKSEVAKRAV